MEKVPIGLVKWKKSMPVRALTCWLAGEKRNKKMA
jgi:hypothetical protein